MNEENYFSTDNIKGQYAAGYKRICWKIGGAICLLGLGDIVVSSVIILILRVLGLYTFFPGEWSYVYIWLVNDLCVYLFPIIALSVLFKNELKEPYRDDTYEHMKGELLIIFPAMIAFGSIGSYITTFVADILDKLFGTGEIPEALASVQPEASVFQSVVYILFVCITGPICEEYIFRYLLLKPLRKYGDWLAVIISSLCFGAFHGNFDQFAYAAFVGMFLAIAVVRTNSIKSSLILHIINNTIVCLSDVLPKFKSTETLPTMGNKIIDGFTTCFSLFYKGVFWVGLGAIAIMIATKMLSLHNSLPEVSNGQKAAGILLNPLVWAGIVMVVMVFMKISL